MTLTGKQRAQRISRAYHSLLDPSIVWKRMLGLVALVLGLAYAAFMFSEPGKKQISTGELSQKHHLFNESGCEKCHLPYTPIRSDALWGSHADVVQRNNSACEKCHQNLVDHFASKTKPEVLAIESCSGCHQEHLGKDKNLLEIANSECIRCHADLSTSSTSSPPLVVATNFNKEHPVLPFENPEPPFGNKPDPGTIKFSHIQHMRAGQPKALGDATAKKLNDLKPELREKYRSRVDANGLIQLTCSDCHERDKPISGLEGLESRNPNLEIKIAIPPSEHMLYEPVRFQKHCLACHPLNDLPHGLNKEQTIDAERKRLSAVSVKDVKDAKKTSSDQAVLTEKIEDLIQDKEERGAVLESSVADACRKCHLLAAAESPDLVLPSKLQTRWLDNASFNHGKHFMIGCIRCHAQAYEESESVDSATEAKRIMIGGMENCRACHIEDSRDRAKANSENPHVASADCIDCHRYHIDQVLGPEKTQKQQETVFLERPWASITARFQWLLPVGSPR